MAWFKVDDGFYSSLKFLSIPREYQAQSAGLWLLAGTWSADKMTDGVVPYQVMDLWDFDTTVIEHLVTVGLWIHEEALNAIRFHDWCDYQPTREILEAKSVQRSERAKQNVAKRWDKSKTDTKAIPTAYEADTNGIQNDTPNPNPNPLSKDRESASRIPSDFALTDEMTSWARSRNFTVNLEGETEKFVNYFGSLPGARAVKTNWYKTWQNWIIRSQEYRPATADVDPWAGKKHLGFDS